MLGGGAIAAGYEGTLGMPHYSLNSDLPVAIVGAGPIGLIAALGLAHHGIPNVPSYPETSFLFENDEPLGLEPHQRFAQRTKSNFIALPQLLHFQSHAWPQHASENVTPEVMKCLAGESLGLQGIVRIRLNPYHERRRPPFSKVADFLAPSYFRVSDGYAMIKNIL